MMGLTALLMLIASASNSQAPERVKLGALASNVHAYVGRPIQVCGVFQEHSSTYPTERILWEGYGSYFSFFVDASGVPLPAENSFGCIVAIAGRRDGLTPAEARAKGLQESYLPDGLQNPDYVLFPLPKQLQPSGGWKAQPLRKAGRLGQLPGDAPADPRVAGAAEPPPCEHDE